MHCSESWSAAVLEQRAMQMLKLVHKPIKACEIERGIPLLIGTSDGKRLRIEDRGLKVADPAVVA